MNVPARREISVRRTLLFSLLAIVLFFGLLEVSARAFLYLTRGSSTVGQETRTLYLNYQPFVMFGPDWEERFARYQRDGARPQPSSAVRVLLLGGSTAALFPTRILEEAFAEAFPSQTFEVINGASGGYNARQAAIVATLWGAQLEPDIVITLDGANDLVHRLRMDRAGTFFLNEAFAANLERPLWAPILHLLRYSQVVQGLVRLQERRAVGPADQYADAIPVYLNAQRSITALAGGLEARRVMVLQPFLSFKQPLSSQEQAFTQFRYRDATVRELFERTSQGMQAIAQKDRVLYIDGRSAFSGVSHTIFSDDVHFVGPEGYRLLARWIVREIRRDGMTLGARPNRVWPSAKRQSAIPDRNARRRTGHLGAVVQRTSRSLPLSDRFFPLRSEAGL